MGGAYPSNSAGWGTIPSFPVPDYRPGRDANWDRDPYNPRRTPRVPKYPWRPPGVFPNGWKPPKTVFGRRLPSVFPPIGVNPTRFVRLNPWFAAGAMILPYFMLPSRIALPGYRTCFDLGGDQSVGRTLSSGCLMGLAGQSGQVFHWPTTNAQIPAVNFTQSVLLGQPNLSMTRATWRFMAEKVAPVPAFGPGPLPKLPPWLISPWWQLPWWDPNLWPPLAPVPYFPPAPLPVWRPQPSMPPRTYPQPVRGPSPEPKIVPDPAVVTTPTGPVVRSPPHVRVHPGPRTKERKFAAKGRWGTLATVLLRIASGVYGGITETVDLVSAIYGALPGEIIARHPDNLKQSELLPFMLGQIYQHIDQIDMEKAVTNIANNAIEDAAWGRYFQAVSRVSERGPNYQGFDRELSELNDLFRELYSGA